jgi:glyoxylase-like metal-dependent hydrolase (beta-lactamase superfamily II)
MGLRARTALDFAAVFVLCLVTVDSFATANEPHPQPAVAAAAAQAGPAPQPPQAHQVRPNIYWISGASGSNSGVIVGDKGLILVDTKTTLDGEKDTVAAIAKISDKPITAVILTHNDLDHVGGLSVLPNGIEIISQQDCKRLMQEAVQKGGRGLNPDFMPTKTYDKRLSLMLDGEKVELYHWAPAHTAGDTVVYLPKEKVVFAGDILATQNPIPFIHLDEGGSASGWIETAKAMLAIDTDTYVAGHGDTANKAAFQQRLDRAVKEQADTKKLIAEGKSIDEIHQALGETTPNPPGPGGRPFPWFSDYVWAEAKK